MSHLEQPPDPMFTFRGRMGQIHCMCIKTECNKEDLYIGTSEGIVHVWDLKIKREQIQIKVGNEACLCIIYNDNIFITQQRGESIKFWQESNYCWKLLRIFIHEYVGFCKIGLIDPYLILPEFEGNVKLFNKKINKEIDISFEEKNVGAVMCIRCLYRSNNILTIFENGHMYLWDLNQRIIKSSKIVDDCPMAVDYFEDSDEGVIGTSGNVLIKFRIGSTNEPIDVIAERNLTNSGVSSVVIREDGKLCVVGCWDGRIRYFTMKKLKLLCVLNHHEGSIETLLFTNKQNFLIAGGKDGRVSLWDLYAR